VSPATIGVLSKILWKKKVLVKITTSGEEYGNISQIKKLPFQSIRKALLRQVDVFVAVNDEVEKELRGFGLNNPMVKIPNGVDTDRFQPVPSKAAKRSLREILSLPETGRLVLYCGRLEPKKALDTLLYAWDLVSRTAEAKDARLIIVGNGSGRASLEDLANRLGIQDSVLFLGKKDRVVEYLQCVDVFVFPSVSEGMSNALLEAMACGMPVVVTDIAGNREVVRHLENGILVKPKEPQQLAYALQAVLNDEDLAQRLGAQARKTVEEGYSIEKVVERYIDVYKSLMC